MIAVLIMFVCNENVEMEVFKSSVEELTTESSSKTRDSRNRNPAPLVCFKHPRHAKFL